MLGQAVCAPGHRPASAEPLDWPLSQFNLVGFESAVAFLLDTGQV
jgi:hypothetical protein